MLAMKEKKSLFGGALRCAGLAATMMTTSAMADFLPAAGPSVPNYTFNYANNGNALFNYDLNYAGGFPLTTQYAGPNGNLAAYAGPGGMIALATINPGSAWFNAGAVTWQYFTVADTKKGDVSWDLTAANAYSFIQVYQFGVGNIAYGLAGSFDSFSISFTAGQLYAFVCRAALNQPGTAYGQLVWEDVPAPGAMGLMSLALLSAGRRRRN